MAKRKKSTKDELEKQISQAHFKLKK